MSLTKQVDSLNCTKSPFLVFPPAGNFNLHLSGGAAQSGRCAHEIQRGAQEARGERTINKLKCAVERNKHLTYGDFELHIFILSIGRSSSLEAVLLL